MKIIHYITIHYIKADHDEIIFAECETNEVPMIGTPTIEVVNCEDCKKSLKDRGQLK